MKRIRLRPQAYEEGAIFSVTIVTADRLRFFESEEIVQTCVGHLREAADQLHANVYAYCFMPDHLHLLADVPAGASFVEFVRRFKQKSSYVFRHLYDYQEQGLWQRRFYDHMLRREDATEEVAQYIWNNPVRAGLVQAAADYPHSGSFAWDVGMSGSKDPDLRGRGPPTHHAVGAGL